MTREILEKGNEILRSIEKVNKTIDYLILKDGLRSANRLTLSECGECGECGESGVDLYLNDPFTHEVLKLMVGHFMHILENLEEEFKNL